MIDYITSYTAQETSLTDDTTWEMWISEKTNLIGLSVGNVVWGCDTALVENQEQVCVL